jgi:hypothetical protein
MCLAGSAANDNASLLIYAQVVRPELVVVHETPVAETLPGPTPEPTPVAAAEDGEPTEAAEEGAPAPAEEEAEATTEVGD